MNNGRDADVALGSWTGDDFSQTASENAGAGANADVSDEVRFLSGIVRFLVHHEAALEANGESFNEDIAIFVLEPNPHASIEDVQPEPMFNNGLPEIGGRLWFTTAAVITAHYVELPQYTNDGDLFAFVTDKSDIGGLPTLIFDSRAGVQLPLRWYPEGLSNAEKCKSMPLTRGVSPDEVFEVIDLIHSESFITPNSMPPGARLWEDSANYYVKSDAEALVQSHLQTGLVSRFPHCKVLHEQPQTAGRTDLEIVEPDRDDRTRSTLHAIIELKVLRSFGATGSSMSDSRTRGQIREGVIQAAAYSGINSPRWSALCCFDLRMNNVTDEECFEHVIDRASDLDVKLWRWFTYASASEYRMAIYGCA